MKEPEPKLWQASNFIPSQLSSQDKDVSKVKEEVKKKRERIKCRIGKRVGDKTELMECFVDEFVARFFLIGKEENGPATERAGGSGVRRDSGGLSAWKLYASCCFSVLSLLCQPPPAPSTSAVPPFVWNTIVEIRLSGLHSPFPRIHHTCHVILV